VFAELGDRGSIFLRGKIFERGDVVEQLSSVMGIQRNHGIVGTATTLYMDGKTKEIKKGATAKDKPGSVRRFREVLKQFELTYDLNGMSKDQILKVLPEEFNTWRTG
jgi:hypothetical protein